MSEAMTSIERVNLAVDLKEADRVPVAPLIIYFQAKASGISIGELFHDPDKAIRALDITFNKLGGYDIIYPQRFGPAHHTLFPHYSHSTLYFDWRISDNAPPQLLETPLIDENGYDSLMRNGLIQFLTFKRCSLSDALYYNFVLPSKLGPMLNAWMNEHKVPLISGATCILPFDFLSFVRGMRGFLIDVHKRPEKILQASDWLVDGEIAAAEIIARRGGAGRVPGADVIWIWGGRSSASFVSPKKFEELVFPYMKRMVNEFVNDGFRVLLHLDGDMTPMFHYMKELPKGKCILELDASDIFKAKRELGDRMCIMGGVSPYTLKMGTPKDVERETKKYIEVCATGGGFITSSQCEVPFDAPVENVKALVDAAKKYGVYKR